MAGFDVHRWMGERRPLWEELDRLLGDVERRGFRALGIDGVRRLGQLYRAVSSDLIRARTELVEASVVDHLNDLTARAYARIHAGQGRRGRRLLRFFVAEYPALVRREWKAVALSAALLLGGGVVGAIATGVDPDAHSVLIPEQHQQVTPDERVHLDRERGVATGDQAAAFSSFLFTHNIQVTFLVFALGLTFGVGTVTVLFANGLPLGALAVEYHAAGHGLFFWAWILPHGVPELTAIFITGGAGLLLARGLLLPGRRRRLDALIHEARRAARIVVGTMPVLVLAGVIEGTISQIHEPFIPSWLKLAFAGLVGVALYSWLALAGRSVDVDALGTSGEAGEAQA